MGVRGSFFKMDVSIAVSLIRGQMGAVVERAVNGAVETVLAEMLKVVGVKFEELKAEVVLMKRDIVALQREKALKEKENDNIRAKLRYTELKLKYYRQGVEEELQQRASASALVRIHPSTFPQAQRGVSSTETSSSCSTQTRSSEGLLTKTNTECTSPHNSCRRLVRVRCQSHVGADAPELLLPVSLSVNTPTECVDSSTVLFCSSERDAAQRMEERLEDDCEWTVALQPHAERVDAAAAPPPIRAALDAAGQQAAEGPRPPGVSTGADSSALPSSGPQVTTQVKQEVLEQEEEEVICIKEEPEDEQEVMDTLLLDCQAQQSHASESEAQSSATEWSGLQTSQRNQSTAFSSAGPSTYSVSQPAAALPSMAALTLGIPPRQTMRPWTKDLSLYEEYKLRRNELRRRSLSRRRELEKTLPQPLLADLVRERREKTRLRVARWRAKRKLQACLNQAQPLGGAAGLSHSGFPLSSQHQQLRAHCAATSSSRQGQSSPLPSSDSFLNMSAASSSSNGLSFIPPTSSSSSQLLRGLSVAPHQHTVTSSSSSYPQVSLSQSISLTDTDILQ